MDKNFLKNLYAHLTQLTAEAISELRKDKKDILSKSDELKQAISKSGDLSVEETAKVTEAINNLHESIKALIEATNASKTEVVSVENLGEAKTDLSPLERNFEALVGSVEAVRTAVQSIPKAKELDLSGVEKLLTKIVDKKDEEVDVSELEVISDILKDVLFAVQTTASFAGKEIENPADKIVPELKSVQEILSVLNKNVEKIDLPEFDYKKLAKIIKENINISVAAGGGVNPAPEINQKLDSVITAINGISGGSPSTVSTNNSTSTLLSGGAVFTGTAEEVTTYSAIVVSVYANVASATDGLSIQFSHNGTNWDFVEPHTVSAGSAHTITLAPQAKYFRVVYTNGGSAQSAFRLQTLLLKSSVGPSMEEVGGDMSDRTVGLSTRSVLFAKSPGGTYGAINRTNGGNLKISFEESDPSASLATSSLYNYVQSEDATTYVYFGYSSTTGWQVKRKTAATSVWEVARGLYTGTYANYAAAWAARASLTYGYA